jgi:hypothetical protein
MERLGMRSWRSRKYAVTDHLTSTLPTSVKNKYWLAAKMIVYSSLGFGIPFGAAAWHM